MENKELIKKLKKEQDGLNKKMLKLLFFIADQEINQTISDNQLNLLKIQHDAMVNYSNVLEMRIRDLKENDNND